MEPGRCSIHGLIVAADGKCVICRRGGASSAEDVPRKSISDSTWAFLIGGSILAIMGGYVVYKDPFRSKASPISEFNSSVTVKTSEASEPLSVAPAARRKPVFITDQAVETAAATPSTIDPVLLDEKQQAQIEAMKKQVRIKMYSKANDDLCKRVRTYFEKHGYSYVDFDIDKSETDKIEMKSLNPAGTVPTFDIEGTVLVGMDRDEFENTLTNIATAKVKQKK